MISRAMQRSNHGYFSCSVYDKIPFNHHVQSWVSATSPPPPILYDPQTAIFTIRQASLSDYILNFTISIKTATADDHFAEMILLQMKYGNGEVTEASCSSCISATGLIKGYKLIHVVRKADQDNLQFWLLNNGFENTFYPTNPLTALPNGLTENDMWNANLCIMSI